MCVFIAKKGELAMEGWKYYNRALIPTTAPHVTPNTYEIYNGNIWRKKMGRIAFLCTMDIKL